MRISDAAKKRMAARSPRFPVLYSVGVDVAFGLATVVVFKGRKSVALELRGEQLEQFSALISEAAAAMCRRNQ